MAWACHTSLGTTRRKYPNCNDYIIIHITQATHTCSLSERSGVVAEYPIWGIRNTWIYITISVWCNRVIYAWRRFCTAMVADDLPGPTTATTGALFLLHPGVWQHEHCVTPSFRKAIVCSMEILSVQQESLIDIPSLNGSSSLISLKFNNSLVF